MSDSPLDITTIRERFATSQGQEYWRGLEELADTEAFREFLHREFPREAAVWEESFSRRRFLQLMGASLALGGLAGCVKQPEEKIIPYVKAPEYMVPGRPLSFATAMVMGGYATGVLGISNMGRPTRIDGNPDHPASLGALSPLASASILTLYDPDRSRVVTRRGAISTWEKFLEAIRMPLQVQQSLVGAGLRILTGNVTSPTLAAQMQALRGVFPRMKWHQYEPVHEDNERAGAVMAFGEPVRASYHFDRADVVLSLDADFLGWGPASVRHARDVAQKRQISAVDPQMNRLYVCESTLTITGGIADHRRAVQAHRIEGIARAIGRRMGIDVGGDELAGDPWLDAVVRDLQAHRGAGIVIAGSNQPPVVHAIVHAINHALGNNGRTVTFTDPVEAQPVDQVASLNDLVRDIEAGSVDLLVVLGGNPVYDAPADLRLAELIGGVKMSIRLGLYNDETSAQCEWHIPESHYLEAWSDARAYDGTATIMQPLIAPLYNSRSAHELLEEFMGKTARKGYDVVREYWRSHRPGEEFEEFWRRSLHDGVVEGTRLPDKSTSLKPLNLPPPSQERKGGEGLEITFRPDPSIWDGRFANNGWLQELPKPFTKLTWDNAALVSPATAERLGLRNNDIVELSLDGRSVRTAVWILPGQPVDSVTLHLGYGRTNAGKVGTGAGANAYALRTSGAQWFSRGLEIRKTRERYTLAVTQLHHSMEGRAIVRAGTLDEYMENPSFAKEMGHPVDPKLTLYPPFNYDGYAWGMVIDLNACTGCNACVVACQSENNIPIVGKEQVERGREMHWIRVDGYFKGDLDDPEVYSQPVPCMHCENAPCETVCPVAATSHDSEGLNVMTYNRCVGTRYCANNCPYKVRRFNFLQYSETESETHRMMYNPDVTVRNRGVMEKCTYCVQRISAARIDAKNEHRAIRDGDVVTACQAACPAQAITFGDINDRNSRVAQLRKDPREYSLLGELNTRPRTTYLARLRNPNPELHQDHSG